MVILGWILIGIAITGGVLAWAADIGYGGTANLHLLSNRQLGLESAGFVLVAGAVFAAVGHLANHLAPAAAQSARKGLGVNLAAVTPKIAARENLPDPGGVLITAVAPGSIAAAAGLLPGDIIRRFEENTIGHAAQLQVAISRIGRGADAVVGIWREGQDMTITLNF